MNINSIHDSHRESFRDFDESIEDHDVTSKDFDDYDETSPTMLLSSPYRRLVVLGWTGSTAEAVSTIIKTEQYYYPADAPSTPLRPRTRVTYPGKIRMIRPKQPLSSDYSILGILVNPIREGPKQCANGMVDTTYNIAFVGNATQELYSISNKYNISARYGLHIIDVPQSETSHSMEDLD